MAAQSSQPKAPIDLRYEIRRLHTKYDRMSNRIGRLERAMYVMIGVGATAVVTAVADLLKLGVQ